MVRKKIFLYFCCISLVIFLVSYLNDKPKNLNVLFITIDALRPDHLGCYGYGRDTSPHIDELAKNGIMFTQTISQSSWTPPAVYSIITSLYPTEHKVLNFGVPLEPGTKTVFEILKNAGYYLSLISGRGALVELYLPNIEKHFDYFYPNSPNYIVADEVTNEAIRWLGDNKQKKFVLWLYYLDPHASYKPPSPYNKLYIDDKFSRENNKHVLIADESRGPYDGEGVISKIAATNGITDINYYISQYDGEIRFVDEQIGRLLKALEHLQLPRDTLIIITSDHGEFLGEHDFYFVHGANLYDVVIKVPLIFKCSSLFKKGRTISQQVASIDIMPTILDILNIKTRIKMSGITLMSMILKNTKPLPLRPIFSEFAGPIHGIKISVRLAGWKLIYNVLNNVSELYNLEKDPGETINLAGIEAAKLISMKKILNSYIRKQKCIENININQYIDKQTKEKLRSLGYLQ